MIDSVICKSVKQNVLRESGALEKRTPDSLNCLLLIDLPITPLKGRYLYLATRSSLMTPAQPRPKAKS